MPKPVQASSYTFRHLIEGGYVYVDKTPYLYELIRGSVGVYFLSRPRRFGKSLLLSTLGEIFNGNKELFRGLWLYEQEYAWQAYSVIRLDFSRHTVKSAEQLEQVIDYFVEGIAQDYNLTLRGFDYQSRFDNLIQQLGRKNKVVILIDEYDKPIIDNLEQTVEAQRIRDVLKNFYTIIKANDEYLRFVFITGISKFSRVGVFSAMNNLNDLTQHPKFATLLGITQAELHRDFAEHIALFAAQVGLSSADLLEKLRHWYNGFCFTAQSENVYNPYSILLCLHHQRFSNFWFESGTPTFLIKLLKERDYDVRQLDELHLRELAFSTYDFENLSIVPLLFQTGYLTIKHYHAAQQLYTLTYPNAEVKDAFLTYLLSAYSIQERAFNDDYLWQMTEALQLHNLDRFFTVLQTFFANVPYELHLKQEKYYQTIFYLIFKLIGLRVDAEVHTNDGRIDAVIELTDHIFLFEFKLDGGAEQALQQIKTHAYYEKYSLQPKGVTLVGVNFDSTRRQVVAWQSEGLLGQAIA